MGEKGISNDSHVVVYDSSNGLWAARVWWMMKMYGHHKVQLLDGGMKAWKKADGDIDHFALKVKAATYEVKSIYYRWTISTEEVASKLDDENFVMIDARSEAES